MIVTLYHDPLEILKYVKETFKKEVDETNAKIEVVDNLDSPAESDTLRKIIRIRKELGKYNPYHLISHELAHIYLYERTSLESILKIFRENIKIERNKISFYFKNEKVATLYLNRELIIFEEKYGKAVGSLRKGDININGLVGILAQEILSISYASLGKSRYSSEILSEYIACNLFPEECLKNNSLSLQKEKLKDPLHKLKHLLGISAFIKERDRYIKNPLCLLKKILDNIPEYYVKTLEVYYKLSITEDKINEEYIFRDSRDIIIIDVDPRSKNMIIPPTVFLFS